MYHLSSIDPGCFLTNIAFLCTHTHTEDAVWLGRRRCSLLSWWTTPVSLHLSATMFTSCVLVNNSIRPFLVSRWLVVGEVVFYVQTNCWNNLPSSLSESGSPVGGGVNNSIVGKCHREPSVPYLTKWTKKKKKPWTYPPLCLLKQQTEATERLYSLPKSQVIVHQTVSLPVLLPYRHHEDLTVADIQCGSLPVSTTV